MDLFPIAGRVQGSGAKRNRNGPDMWLASGSERAHSPFFLGDAKPVIEHMARARSRSLEARTADRIEIASARQGDGEHV